MATQQEEKDVVLRYLRDDRLYGVLRQILGEYLFKHNSRVNAGLKEGFFEEAMHGIYEKGAVAALNEVITGFEKLRNEAIEET